MNTKLAIFVGFLHICTIIAVEGRFDKQDKLSPAPKDLQYAFIIFRHGLRSPVSNIYGSHEEFLKRWPDGKGKLTEDGKRLMFHVGQSLRTRYKSLVPDYDMDQVEFTSTLNPRVAMSAYSVAAGMFPPSPDEVISEDVPSWQPISVWHTAYYDKADLFIESKKISSCPRYTKIRESIIDEEMDILYQMQDTNLKKLNKKLITSNSQIKTIKSAADLFNVWDVYFMEKLSNTPSQSWTKWMMPTMEKLGHFTLWSEMHGKNDGQNSILQYFTGPMLSQVLNEMLHQISECSLRPECRPRLHLHGSHDLILGAMLWALADNQNALVVYPGDTLILEAYQHQQVKLFLYSPLRSGRKLKPLSLKGVCKQKVCKLADLRKGLQALGLIFTEEEWRQKCSDMTGAEDSTWREIPKHYFKH